MRAPLGQFQGVPLPPLILSLKEQEQLQESGIEIPIEEIRILANQTLAYKDTHVVLYIRTPKNYEPKFHIANCEKLKQMRSNHRFDRYVVSTREDGAFEIEKFGQNKTVHLEVCQYCLNYLEWMGFSHQKMSSEDRRKMVRSFSLKEFFNQYGRLISQEFPHSS